MNDMIKISDFSTDKEIEFNEENNYMNEDDDNEYDDVSILKKQVSLGDIVLLQCKLCVMIIISFVILNFIKKKLTNNNLNNFKIEIDKPFEFKKEIAEIYEKLSKYINAKI